MAEELFGKDISVNDVRNVDSIPSHVNISPDTSSADAIRKVGGFAIENLLEPALEGMVQSDVEAGTLEDLERNTKTAKSYDTADDVPADLDGEVTRGFAGIAALRRAGKRTEAQARLNALVRKTKSTPLGARYADAIDERVEEFFGGSSLSTTGTSRGFFAANAAEKAFEAQEALYKLNESFGIPREVTTLMEQTKRLAAHQTNQNILEAAEDEREQIAAEQMFTFGAMDNKAALTQDLLRIAPNGVWKNEGDLARFKQAASLSFDEKERELLSLMQRKGVVPKDLKAMRDRWKEEKNAFVSLLGDTTVMNLLEEANSGTKATITQWLMTAAPETMAAQALWGADSDVFKQYAKFVAGNEATKASLKKEYPIFGQMFSKTNVKDLAAAAQGWYDNIYINKKLTTDIEKSMARRDLAQPDLPEKMLEGLAESIKNTATTSDPRAPLAWTDKAVMRETLKDKKRQEGLKNTIKSTLAGGGLRRAMIAVKAKDDSPIFNIIRDQAGNPVMSIRSGKGSISPDFKDDALEIKKSLDPMLSIIYAYRNYPKILSMITDGAAKTEEEALIWFKDRVDAQGEVQLGTTEQDLGVPEDDEMITP